MIQERTDEVRFGKKGRMVELWLSWWCKLITILRATILEKWRGCDLLFDNEWAHVMWNPFKPPLIFWLRSNTEKHSCYGANISQQETWQPVEIEATSSSALDAWGKPWCLLADPMGLLLHFCRPIAATNKAHMQQHAACKSLGRDKFQCQTRWDWNMFDIFFLNRCWGWVQPHRCCFRGASWSGYQHVLLLDWQLVVTLFFFLVPDAIFEDSINIMYILYICK